MQLYILVEIHPKNSERFLRLTNAMRIFYNCLFLILHILHSIDVSKLIGNLNRWHKELLEMYIQYLVRNFLQV
jgi:hypothetical protein